MTVGKHPAGAVSAADRKAATLAMALASVAIGSSAEPSHSACMGTTVRIGHDELGAGSPSTPTTVTSGRKVPQRYCGVYVRDGVLGVLDWEGVLEA